MTIINSVEDLNNHPTGRYYKSTFLEILKGSLSVDYNEVEIFISGGNIYWKYGTRKRKMEDYVA